MDSIKEILNDHLCQDCSGMVINYLTPLPPLPFIQELEEATREIYISLDIDIEWISRGTINRVGSWKWDILPPLDHVPPGFIGFI
jgi:hypothetical protein